MTGSDPAGVDGRPGGTLATQRPRGKGAEPSAGRQQKAPGSRRRGSESRPPLSAHPAQAEARCSPFDTGALLGRPVRSRAHTAPALRAQGLLHSEGPGFRGGQWPARAPSASTVTDGSGRAPGRRGASWRGARAPRLHACEGRRTPGRVRTPGLLQGPRCCPRGETWAGSCQLLGLPHPSHKQHHMEQKN